MERCPCCNARLRERKICSRCKADLSVLISAEQAAEFWFAKAIQYHLADNIELSIVAIGDSLRLKKTQIALTFREFLIQQQCRDILDLLAQKQLIVAKQKLYSVRKLLPYSKQLQQLNSFNDYLLAQSQDQSHSLQHSVRKIVASIFNQLMSLITSPPVSSGLK